MEEEHQVVGNEDIDIRRISQELNKMTKIRCIGCGDIIAGDVEIKGGWDYTCSCGGHLFTFDGKLSIPSSLLTYIAYKNYGDKSPLGTRVSVPHIEYYIGYSDYMDYAKKCIMDQLKFIGAISMEDCQDEECKRHREERITRLWEALADDYWSGQSNWQLAAHFQLPISKVEEIKNRQNNQNRTT